MSKPKWLTQPEGLEDRALSVWRYYGPGLHSCGRLGQNNAESFRSLCRILALCEAGSEQIEREGTVIKLSTGTVRAHPAVKIVLDAQKAAVPLLRLFGLHQEAQQNVYGAWEVK